MNVHDFLVAVALRDHLAGSRSPPPLAGALARLAVYANVRKQHEQKGQIKGTNSGIKSVADVLRNFALRHG